MSYRSHSLADPIGIWVTVLELEKTWKKKITKHKVASVLGEFCSETHKLNQDHP